MSKFQEDRIYDIMSHLNGEPELHEIYKEEYKKSLNKYPRSEAFTRLEKCYEKAIKIYERI